MFHSCLLLHWESQKEISEFLYIFSYSDHVSNCDIAKKTSKMWHVFIKYHWTCCYFHIQIFNWYFFCYFSIVLSWAFSNTSSCSRYWSPWGFRDCSFNFRTINNWIFLESKFKCNVVFFHFRNHRMHSFFTFGLNLWEANKNRNRWNFSCTKFKQIFKKLKKLNNKHLIIFSFMQKRYLILFHICGKSLCCFKLLNFIALRFFLKISYLFNLLF